MTVSPVSSIAAVTVQAIDSLATALVEAIDNADIVQPASASPEAAPPSALAAAVQSAAGRQGGLATLFADLGGALQTPGLPQPVAAAVVRLLALQRPIDPAPTAADVRQALTQSGLLLEARLAAEDAAAGPDIKAALLRLSQVLEAWLGEAPSHAPTAKAPPPPFRGGPTTAQPATTSDLAPDAAAEVVGHRLLQGAAAALARLVLLQAASQANGPSPATGGTVWLFEVPLATPQGSAVAQFEIGREPSRAGDDEDQAVWRVRFSIDVEPQGPVHAKVTLSGGRAQVTLWAERGETAGRLQDQQAALAEALRSDDLEASVAVYPGAPSIAAPSVGQFVDQAL